MNDAVIAREAWVADVRDGTALGDSVLLCDGNGPEALSPADLRAIEEALPTRTVVHWTALSGDEVAARSEHEAVVVRSIPPELGEQGLDAVVPHVKPGGMIIIVEPATRWSPTDALVLREIDLRFPGGAR